MADLAINTPVGATAGPSGRSASVHRSAPISSPASDQEAQSAPKVLADLGNEPTSSHQKFIDNSSLAEDQQVDEPEPEANASDSPGPDDDEGNSTKGDNDVSDPDFVPPKQPRSASRKVSLGICASYADHKISSDDLDLGQWSARPPPPRRTVYRIETLFRLPIVQEDWFSNGSSRGF
jgi:hypothetical protein